jgi:general secretion pathway protein C
MLDTRTTEWLSRLQGNGPRLVSYALAALIAVEAAGIAISLLTRNPVRAPQPITAAPPNAHKGGVDVQSVVSAHLFGVATADPSQDTGNPPASTANLVLAGTIATQDPKHGVAIISDGGPSKVYAVGDNVGGAALHSVYLDRVILDRAGSLETLLLPRILPPSHTAGRAPGANPRTVAAVENIRRMVQQDPGLLDQVMRTVPSYDNAAGKLRGFRAYPGRNRAIFNKLGLKPGDLVTAINGTALDDPQRSQEVFNTIQTSDHVSVSIERGGQKQEITLNIAQVAAQATRDVEYDAAMGSGTPAAGAEPSTAVPGPNGGPMPPSGAPGTPPMPSAPPPSAVPPGPGDGPNN